MGDIGKYIVIGGAVLIVAVIFLVIIKTRNGFVVPKPSKPAGAD